MQKGSDPTHRPASQSFSFQNGDVSPFSLHSFHTLRPVEVHHHHFDPLAGFWRVSHLCSFQYGESLPLALHSFQTPRPASLQNHHLLLYNWTLLPDELDQLLYAFRNPLLVESKGQHATATNRSIE